MRFGIWLIFLTVACASQQNSGPLVSSKAAGQQTCEQVKEKLMHEMGGSGNEGPQTDQSIMACADHGAAPEQTVRNMCIQKTRAMLAQSTGQNIQYQQDYEGVLFRMARNENKLIICCKLAKR